MNAGPPPVTRQPSQPTPASRALATLNEVKATLTADKGAEARAIRAMFNHDPALSDRFLAVAFSALAGDDNLLSNATPLSIVQAVKDAASMGLEPSGLDGEGFINVYKGIAAFQPMYRGYLKRIRNSGKVLDVDTQVVYEHDEFRIELGTNPNIVHLPALGERGGYKGAYAWALMPSGLRLIEWMNDTDIRYVRDKFSPSVKNNRPSPWDTSYGEMARKTVLRRLSKRLPGEAVNALLSADARVDALAGTIAGPEVSRATRLALAAVGGNGGATEGQAEPAGAPSASPPGTPPSAQG